MVRSDRYRWYELDRAKRTAKLNRNSIKVVNAKAQTRSFRDRFGGAKTKINARRAGRETTRHGRRWAESSRLDIGFARDQRRREWRREFLFSPRLRRGNKCCGSD